MFQYTVRRLAIAMVTLLGITVITFFLINLMPGDPASLQSDVQEHKVSPQHYEELRRHFGLDKPILERYLQWLGNLVRGDFGTSFQDGRPVGTKLMERLPATAWISVLSILLGLAAAIPIGLFQAARHNGWFDKVSGIILYALYAIPSYVGAILLVYYVSVKWDLLPFRGMKSDDYDTFSTFGKAKDLVQHGTLITICFTYTAIAFDSRFVRANMLEVLRQDYVRTARAKGVPERRVVFKHAFRNTFIPLLTRLGQLVPALVSGSVILENIFNWPGLGRLAFEGITARDYPVMMGSVLAASMLVLLGILISDLSYAFADPRIKYD